jgi:hypothetical protein
MSEMDYKETLDLVDKAVDKALGSYAKATSELIASELGSLRKELSYVNDNTRSLADQFKLMNGKLRDVCEWKATHVEETKSLKEKLIDIAASRMTRVDMAFRALQMVVLVTSVAFAIYFGAQNLKMRDRQETQQEQTK